MNPKVSVVIPVFNEAGNVLPLLETTVAVMRGLSRPFEVIVVNDGSTDATAVEISTAAARWPECRELSLGSNSGQATALLTGLQAARGRWIVTLDGDGQNDPRDIPLLLTSVMNGQLDVACGWRERREDGAVRRLMSRVANGVRRVVLRDGLHDAGCQLRALSQAVVPALRPMELLQSFLPSLAVHAGFRVGEFPVRHHPRRRGTSKYGFFRLWWRPAVAMFALRWRLSRGKQGRESP
jgi:dolichol-phosphate mannosyltransferase